MPHSSVLSIGTTRDMSTAQQKAIVAINFNRRMAAGFRQVGNAANAERAERIVADREADYLKTYGTPAP